MFAEPKHSDMNTATFELNGIQSLQKYAKTLKKGKAFKNSKVFPRGNVRTLAHIILSRYEACGETSVELNPVAAHAFGIDTESIIRVCAAVNPFTGKPCIVQL